MRAERLRYTEKKERTKKGVKTKSQRDRNGHKKTDWQKDTWLKTEEKRRYIDRERRIETKRLSTETERELEKDRQTRQRARGEKAKAIA